MIKFFITVFFAISALFGFDVAHAQLQQTVGDLGTEDLGIATTTDFKVVLTDVLKVVLGFVGIVAVGIIIYGGIVYMTAKGDEDKTKLAKKIIINSVIGLVVVLFSYAIVAFVANQFGTDVGTDTGSVPDSGPCDGCSYCCPVDICSAVPCGSIPPETFSVLSISPAGPNIPDGYPQNSRIAIVFNQSVNMATVVAGISITADGSPVAGTFDGSGHTVYFSPNDACPSNPGETCFPASTVVTVSLGDGPSGVLSSDGKELNCGAFGGPCDETFEVGSYIDTDSPDGLFISPAPMQSVYLGVSNTIEITGGDDGGFNGGLNNMQYKADAGDTWFYPSDVSGVTVHSSASTPCGYAYCRNWSFDFDFAGKTPDLSVRRMSAKLEDVTGKTTVTDVSYRLLPAHCGNGMQDGDEEGMDCGGSCGGCEGSACRFGDACGDEYCSAGTYCNTGAGCVCERKPVILGVDTGHVVTGGSVKTAKTARGNIITIYGRDFGTGGTVYFNNGAGGVAGGSLAGVCEDTWTDKQIVIEVPNGALSGSFGIETSTGGMDGSTGFSDKEPEIILDIQPVYALPGLCEVDGSSAEPLQPVTAKGKQFGTTVGDITFGTQASSDADTWTDDEIAGIEVPVIEPGLTTVRVTNSSGKSSNAVLFTAQAEGTSTAPYIVSVDPTTVAFEDYITIQGRNFGGSKGVKTVQFLNASNAVVAEALYTFPEACAGGTWRNDHVVVKTPTLSPGEYRIALYDSSTGLQLSNTYGAGGEVPITFQSGVAKPGLCLLTPDKNIFAGKGRSYDFIAYGERFGSNGEISVPSGIVKTPTVSETSVEFSLDAIDTDSIESGQVMYKRDGDEAQSNGMSIEVFDASSVPEIGDAFFQIRFRTSDEPTHVEVRQHGCENDRMSPTPKNGETNVCTNAKIGVSFEFPRTYEGPVVPEMSDAVGDGFVNSVNVFTCGEADLKDCSVWTEIPAGQMTYAGSADSNNIEIVEVSGFWDTNTWHRVVVQSGDDGLIDNQFAEPVHMLEPYIFTFKTGDDTCVPESVSIGHDESVFVNDVTEAVVSMSANACQLINPIAGSTIRVGSGNDSKLALQPNTQFVGDTRDVACVYANPGDCASVFARGIEETLRIDTGEHVPVVQTVEYTDTVNTVFGDREVTVEELPFALVYDSRCDSDTVTLPSPAPGSRVATTAPIYLEFTHPVDAASLNVARINGAVDVNAYRADASMTSSVADGILVGIIPNTGSDLGDPLGVSDSEFKFEMNIPATVLAEDGSSLAGVYDKASGKLYRFNADKTFSSQTHDVDGSSADVGLSIDDASDSIIYSFVADETIVPTVEYVSVVASDKKLGLGLGIAFGKTYTGVAYDAQCRVINPADLNWSFGAVNGNDCNADSYTHIIQADHVATARAYHDSNFACYADNDLYNQSIGVSVNDGTGFAVHEEMIEVFSPFLDASSGPLNGSARARIPTGITLSGERFGTSSEGSAWFVAGYGFTDPEGNAVLPETHIQSRNICDYWTDTEAVVGTPTLSADEPDGSARASLYVERKASSTATVARSNMLDFIPNKTVRPTLCSISPEAGTAGDVFTVTGKNLGDEYESE